MLQATVSLVPDFAGPVTGGSNVSFNVVLDSFTPDKMGDVIDSFTLDISASDSSLTAGGTDFSRFGFRLDADLTGKLNGNPLFGDADISDNGFVLFFRDGPPFGTDTGILDSDDGIFLGQLSVLAPSTAGIYNVGLNVNNASPFLGTNFTVGNDILPGIQTIPGDGTLTVNNSSFTVSGVNVVPEPSTLTLFLAGIVSLFVVGQRTMCRSRVAEELS